MQLESFRPQSHLATRTTLVERLEYFSYSAKDPPTQGRWRVYGLHLPDDVLAKIYSANAKHILSPKEGT